MDDHPPTAHPPAATQRLFIALAPPDDAKGELDHALRHARADHPRLRWNRIEDWHITLAFLGEQPRAAATALRAALAAPAAAHPAPRLNLYGGGHFDDRLLYARVGGDLQALHRLAEEVRALARACGADYRPRPFNPHLTLARARRDDPAAVPRAAATLAAFTGRPWPAERLHLVGGEPGPGPEPGPVRYRDIQAWPLTPAARA
ncbi:RNA 2',3'-cyclic phosphodiesterase [Kitasatospora sp. NPDC101183]|uniref:RNA 2',3'-cyclic phosphodiesterase n=1 Tax=Kitasatospora sp. NPDC101183 TaxID=3364100 RepID=UPI003820050B